MTMQRRTDLQAWNLKLDKVSWVEHILYYSNLEVLHNLLHNPFNVEDQEEIYEHLTKGYSLSLNYNKRDKRKDVFQLQALISVRSLNIEYLNIDFF